MGGKIRHAARHGNLAVDDFCSEARQEQIKIGRQPLQRQEVMIDRDIIGHTVTRSFFSHLPAPTNSSIVYESSLSEFSL